MIAAFKLRPGTPEDFKINDNTWRYGQAYAVVNADGKTLSGMHVINRSTDPFEIKKFLEENRIFVPVSCLDYTIEILEREEAA